MFRRAKVLMAAVIVAGSAVVAAGAPAWAVGATLTPNTQSINYGGTGRWTGSWSGGSPYNTTFTYGDGASTVINSTTATSRAYTHVFYPCATTNFSERLSITAIGGGSTTASATATTHVNGGGAC